MEKKLNRMLRSGAEKSGQRPTANNQLKTENNDLKMQLAQSNTKVKSLEDQLADAKERNADLKEQYASLQRSLEQSLQQNSEGNINISKLVDEINASNKFIKQLVEAKSKSDSLNMLLTNNLTRSLSGSEKDEVDVKVLKGVVYISLADNMLYKSGSYEINSRASETLGKIAKIITDYKDYDVLIEGNTDNVPISRTNIRNNWDLSALRASSVVQCLQNEYGVDPKRLTVGGRGEYNPIATNELTLRKALEQIGPSDFSRYQQLLQLLRSKEYGWTKETSDRVVIFTERIETMKYLAAQFQKDLQLKPAAIQTICGSMSDDEQQIRDEFSGILKSIAIAVFLVLRLNQTEIARQIDALGLKERIASMLALRDSTDEIADLQREDALRHLATVKVSALHGRISVLSVVLVLLAIFTAAASVLVPSACFLEKEDEVTVAWKDVMDMLREERSRLSEASEKRLADEFDNLIGEMEGMDSALRAVVKIGDAEKSIMNAADEGKASHDAMNEALDTLREARRMLLGEEEPSEESEKGMEGESGESMMPEESEEGREREGEGESRDEGSGKMPVNPDKNGQGQSIAEGEIREQTSSMTETVYDPISGSVPYGKVFSAYYNDYLREAENGDIPYEFSDAARAYFDNLDR